MRKVSKHYSRNFLADTSITRRFGGTGLGMAIVKNLVEAFNGKIDVSSVLGQGTTTSIELSSMH